MRIQQNPEPFCICSWKRSFLPPAPPPPPFFSFKSQFDIVEEYLGYRYSDWVEDEYPVLIETCMFTGTEKTSFAFLRFDRLIKMPLHKDAIPSKRQFAVCCVAILRALSLSPSLGRHWAKDPKMSGTALLTLTHSHWEHLASFSLVYFLLRIIALWGNFYTKEMDKES